MAISRHQIVAIYERLKKITKNEQVLIRALGEELCSADQQLLEDVRNVTVEHEVRRTVILTELQELAARIGALPSPDEPVETLEYEDIELPYYIGNEEPDVAKETPHRGDWRQAARNIRDAPDLPGNGAGIAVYRH